MYRQRSRVNGSQEAEIERVAMRHGSRDERSPGPDERSRDGESNVGAMLACLLRPFDGRARPFITISEIQKNAQATSRPFQTHFSNGLQTNVQGDSK